MTTVNFHGLLEAQAHLLEVGVMQIPADHEALSIVCCVGLHADFSPMKFSLAFRHSIVKWTWIVSEF